MSDEASEREKLVQAILRRPQQPTLEDAVKVLQFDTIKTVDTLLALDGKLRRMWWDRRSDTTWE